MSICQREMKRRPVGICYRRTGQPVWKISSKSFSVALLIHEKRVVFFATCALWEACYSQIKPSEQRWTYGRCEDVRYALDTRRAPFLYSILFLMAAIPRDQQCDHDLECSQRILKGQKKGREGQKKREEIKKMEVMMTRDGRTNIKESPTRGTWGALRGGRKWLVAETEWEQERAAEEKEGWRDGEY